LEAALAAQGQTKADFAVQMKIQILLEKMLGKDVSVTDEEINTYFTENKDTFDKGATLESEKEEIKNVLLQQKLSEKLQSWLTNLQSKAKIIYFIKF
jgi:foldase protein PrsA